jgi:hypothetical protein
VSEERNCDGIEVAIHESIVGSDEFTRDVEVAGSTRGQRAVVALQLVDALVGNGGFEAVTYPDLLRAALEASEVVGAPEHRSLLESRDTEQRLVLQGLLHDRLRTYVEAHEHEFFIDSEEAAATADRLKATFADQDEWLTRAIEDVDRADSGQEWLVQHFGDRGIYSETSALLLLRPEDMRQALKAATDTKYQPHELAFYAHFDAPPKWEKIESDPVNALDAGVALHAPCWVAVELR